MGDNFIILDWGFNRMGCGIFILPICVRLYSRFIYYDICSMLPIYCLEGQKNDTFD